MHKIIEITRLILIRVHDFTSFSIETIQNVSELFYKSGYLLSKDQWF